MPSKIEGNDAMAHDIIAGLQAHMASMPFTNNCVSITKQYPLARFVIKAVSAHVNAVIPNASLKMLTQLNRGVALMI